MEPYYIRAAEMASLTDRMALPKLHREHWLQLHYCTWKHHNFHHLTIEIILRVSHRRDANLENCGLHRVFADL